MSWSVQRRSWGIPQEFWLEYRENHHLRSRCQNRKVMETFILKVFSTQEACHELLLHFGAFIMKIQLTSGPPSVSCSLCLFYVEYLSYNKQDPPGPVAVWGFYLEYPVCATLLNCLLSSNQPPIFISLDATHPEFPHVYQDKVTDKTWNLCGHIQKLCSVSNTRWRLALSLYSIINRMKQIKPCCVVAWQSVLCTCLKACSRATERALDPATMPCEYWRPSRTIAGWITVEGMLQQTKTKNK